MTTVKRSAVVSAARAKAAGRSPFVEERLDKAWPLTCPSREAWACAGTSFVSSLSDSFAGGAAVFVGGFVEGSAAEFPAPDPGEATKLSMIVRSNMKRQKDLQRSLHLLIMS